MDESKIIQKLIEHDQRFDQMVTKEEFKNFRNEVLVAQDEMITILRRLDQERIFTTEWVRRIEGEVEKHRQEIGKIKEILKIS